MGNLASSLDFLSCTIEVVVGVGVLGETDTLLVLHTRIKGSRSGLVGLSVDLASQGIGRVRSPNVV